MFGLIASRTSNFKDQNKTLDSVMELRNLEQDSKPSLLSTNIQVSFEMSSFVTLFWPQSQIYRSFLVLFRNFESVWAKSASRSWQGQTQPHVERESSLGTSAADISALPTTSGFPSDKILPVFLQASLGIPFVLWPRGLCLAWSSKRQRPQHWMPGWKPLAKWAKVALPQAQF